LTRKPLGSLDVDPKSRANPSLDDAEVFLLAERV
jgi:hypothetical protein